MNANRRTWRDTAVCLALVAGGLALLGLTLLHLVGFDLAGDGLIAWRDHPFDWTNMRFTGTSLSLAQRLWAYDPRHLFGWTPNVFYNPLASLLGAGFTGLLGGGAWTYRVWLLALLVLSPLSLLILVPRTGLGRLATWAIGLGTGLLTFVIYPTDVGIIDADPVQVLYTGQWAQRLGLAFGLLAIGLFARALVRTGREVFQPLVGVAALWGASLFSHYMSGYATGVVLAAISVFAFLARRLTEGRFRFGLLLALPLTVGLLSALAFDFLWAFFSVNASHHSLPTLGWRLPEAALNTLKDVLLPGLPVLLIPLFTLPGAGPDWRKRLPGALLPWTLALVFLSAGAAGLLPGAVLVLAVGLWTSRVEGQLASRHWLPFAIAVVGLLSCGPDSLRLAGLDLSGWLPFASAVGWAKLAAMARFLIFAWLGVLVAHGLTHQRAGWVRPIVVALGLTGVLLPIGLSLAKSPGSGAQTFFDWMRQADPVATEKLAQRMRRAARQSQPDGFLLIEDTLHQAADSALADRHLPLGHLPYLTGPETDRPVLGGAVTTRTITHPLAHTSREMLLCADRQAIQDHPEQVLTRLQRLGISDLLVHTTWLDQVLEESPLATRIDRAEGLSHFRLAGYQPVVPAGVTFSTSTDGLDIALPAGQTEARLRFAWYPFLTCTIAGPDGDRPCRISAWHDEIMYLTGCLQDKRESLRIDVPWIQVNLDPADPAGAGKVRLHIQSRPVSWPFWIMLLTWLTWLVWAMVRWVTRIRTGGGRGISPTYNPPG